jgi:hypothetical protein
MSLFAIIRASEPEKLKAAIEKTYENNFKSIGPREWLVSDKASPEEVSNKLGISEGESGTGMVLKVDAYFGRAQKDIWDWMEAKLAASDDKGA